jgi:hypothetical protein
MSISPIYQDLTPINAPLKKLFLDPNNPRFVNSGWQEIAEEDIMSEPVQEDTRVRAF